jgi:hypothetical protein
MSKNVYFTDFLYELLREKKVNIIVYSMKMDANDTTMIRHQGVTINVSKSAHTNNHRTKRNISGGGGGGGETEQSNVDLVSTKTYGENDVSLMDSSSDSRVAGHTPQRAEQQQASGDDMMMASGATDLSSAATATTSAPVAPIDIMPVNN